MLEDRIRQLNTATADRNGKTVIYQMSRDQRLQDNHALLAAQQEALTRKLPLVIVFNFSVHTNRSREHYQFMIDGLKELEKSAKTLNIPVVFGRENRAGLLNKINQLKPAAVYFDFSPLKGSINLHASIAKHLTIPCYEVDTHNIIPVWVASNHQEFAAHTFRTKVHKHLPTFLKHPSKPIIHPYDIQFNLNAEMLEKSAGYVLSIAKPCGINVENQAGEVAAHNHLQNFLTKRLVDYAHLRNDPSLDRVSGLSPYLHFGQISSLRVALEVLVDSKAEPLLTKEVRMASPGESPSAIDGMNALFEEMIVRKELSDNFCLYAKNYKDVSGVPAWATSTLNEHRHDTREFVYTLKQWEMAATHDPAWNAAQNQLRKTGKMHGYMRMYWAKKMLEWSTSPEHALADCIYLNDKYSIDGGDPNGYAGILWSIAGLHDRPWTERPIFGKIRYMNYAGLKRKFNIEHYIQTWDEASRAA